MLPDIRTRMKFILLGIFVAVCFFIVSGFRLPTPPASNGSYQFFKEKESTGVWVFETDTGISKYFDLEKGVVIVNSFQMDSITVKSGVKTNESKKP